MSMLPPQPPWPTHGGGARPGGAGKVGSGVDGKQGMTAPDRSKPTGMSKMPGRAVIDPVNGPASSTGGRAKTRGSGKSRY